jgi:ubiquinone/menaquinone biosynthesis C-methylase UbiE
MLRKLLMDAFGVPVGFWGRVGGRIMGVSNRDINELTVALLEAGPRDRVLEIGYGPGTALALLGEQASEGFVAGVDPSAEMARQARRRNRLLIQRGRVGLAIGTSARLPFRSGQFDRVCTTNTLYFWPTPPADLAEMHRVLKPGGRAVVTFRGKRDPSGALSVRTVLGSEYLVEQVAVMLTGVGLHDVQTQVRQLRFVTAVSLVARA